ncbi:hypothetical protein ON010_g5723 [Phytophthora cinnamomi]|nr:hypothetical protein ON010_g5723 [Phytophthora cinnamomi]
MTNATFVLGTADKEDSCGARGALPVVCFNSSTLLNVGFHRQPPICCGFSVGSAQGTLAEPSSLRASVDKCYGLHLSVVGCDVKPSLNLGLLRGSSQTAPATDIRHIFSVTSYDGEQQLGCSRQWEPRGCTVDQLQAHPAADRALGRRTGRAGDARPSWQSSAALGLEVRPPERHSDRESVAEKEQAPALLQKKIDNICPRLAEVPDFYCEMHVDVSTWIPGVSRWLPSDTVKIWKTNQDMRFDITLVGFENGKWDRGDLSFLLQGSQGKFLCLDNEAKTCTDLLKLDTELTEVDLDQMVHFLMTTSIVTTDFDASKVAFEKKCAWFSSSAMRQDIGCWKDTRIVDMTGVEASLRYRKPHDPKHPPPASSNDQTSACDAVSLLTEATAIGDHYTEVVVDPKSNHIVSVELKKREELTWKFSTERRDINFGVRFLEENNGEEWEEIVALQRMQSQLKEQTGSFRATCAGTLVFTWDNSYSVIRSKLLRFAINPGGEKDRDSTGSEHWDSQMRVKEEEMTFEDWFGVPIESLPASLRVMRPRRYIMVHSQPSCRKITKSFPATVHMCDHFPLSVSVGVPPSDRSALQNHERFREHAGVLLGGKVIIFCSRWQDLLSRYRHTLTAEYDVVDVPGIDGRVPSPVLLPFGAVGLGDVPL